MGRFLLHSSKKPIPTLSRCWQFCLKGTCLFSNHEQEHDACGVGFIYRQQAQHSVLSDALQALINLEHRGACSADGKSGDGAGVLTAIPWKLLGISPEERIAVGMVFQPEGRREECRRAAERLLRVEGMQVVAWRNVPVNKRILGSIAASTCPDIEQVFLRVPNDMDEETVERRLMVVRKRLINFLHSRPEFESYYLSSLSMRTIVYKAMVRSQDLAEFYLDLKNEHYETNYAVFHRRFSTNTVPRWHLAQPFRMLGHNGEINTILANRNWMKAREQVLEHPAWGHRKRLRYPILGIKGSDSANLDNAMEMLVRAGNSAEAALMQLIPEAFRNQPALEEYPEISDFYEYMAALQEPWDGPALIVFCDGRTIGATMDRNGLRPARFTVCSDGTVILASEAGAVPVDQSSVIERGRLGPGEMLSIDLASGELGRNWQIKQKVASQHSYGDWLKNERINFESRPFSSAPEMTADELLRLQIAFGYGKEDVENVLNVMPASGTEPVFSMGDDTPLAILSKKPKVLFDFFRQLFAQVTNPAIDHLRERLVMSLDSYILRRGELLRCGPDSARAIHLATPVINEQELQELTTFGDTFKSERLSLAYDASTGDMSAAIDALCDKAMRLVMGGTTILILSDRGLDSNTVPIPPLLAVGALHQHLVRTGLRLDCSIIVETAQCWSTHHFACLLGYGAQAICPYLSLETIRHWFASDKTKQLLEKAESSPDTAQPQLIGLTAEKAQHNYKKAIETGILKIMAKLGISSLSSYIGAQAFECLGLGPEVIWRCFEGTPSRLGGMEVADIERETRSVHAHAFDYCMLEDGIPPKSLPDFGNMVARKDGEFHGNNPELVRTLHQALSLRKDAPPGVQASELFSTFSQQVENRPPTAIRDLLEIKSERAPIPVSFVEPAADIARRFCTGGMSLGALSKEAHEVLAIAMNRLGGKSNSGEGGEDPLRYRRIADIKEDGTSESFPGLTGLLPGDNAASAIRQVASARFGVTPEYLVTSKQLEIKIGQGAKPGEGGQLPGAKVSEYIARLRRAKPGTTLISPPPHHDIYSIEDLAQLIYDLHQVNPFAKVSVKLVAGVGIGTIAAGVAKANADIIHVSGHDGGTGASPLTSIKHAGVPWELGLAETHQTLLRNGLRNRVALRVDGGMRTGRDILIAAMLGANEYGFGSIALIAEGCIMARVCHTNNCPVGITSQKEQLRKKLPGNPQSVVDFFMLVAEEVRQLLAALGYYKLDEIVGRADLLKPKANTKLAKVESLILDSVTERFPIDDRAWLEESPDPRNDGIVLDDLILDDDCKSAIDSQGGLARSYPIKNTDRTVGARLSGTIARLYGDTGFGGTINLKFRGSAGQSFGAFNVKGVNLFLEGESNDYVGKGMAGGKIVIAPFSEMQSGGSQVGSSGKQFRSSDNTIAGNTCLYGATGGTLFAAGRVGERFAVRNSGAIAVIEGAGDHCCEYMTGGAVVVLGSVGRNFGAGMTGGTAYVLDEDNSFSKRFNPDGDKLFTRVSDDDSLQLKQVIEEFHRETGSTRAAEILKDWDRYCALFHRVLTPSESAVPVAS